MTGLHHYRLLLPLHESLLQKVWNKLSGSKLPVMMGNRSSHAPKCMKL